MRAEKFTSRIDILDTGMRMHVIPVPPEVADRLRKSKRVIINIGEIELKRAMHGVKSGSPYLMIGKQVLRELGLRLGSEVSVKLREDPQPDRIDVAPELLEALKQDPEANARWQTFPPGKRRSINHYVESAKREDTRIRRAVDITEKIRTNTLYGD